MAAKPRRIGCGCLPVVFLFVVGAVGAMLLVGGREGIGLGLVVAAVGAVIVVGAMVGVVLSRAGRATRETELSQPPPHPEPRPPSTPRRSPPERSAREVRSGPRGLTTDPESDEARTLKQRLSEAVSDLADNVEGMPTPGQGESRYLSSEEMIARAKRRIRERADETDP
ncbi:MAG: hypothetical protein ACLFWM_11390 [Actinomycetota bacterium]